MGIREIPVSFVLDGYMDLTKDSVIADMGESVASWEPF